MTCMLCKKPYMKGLDFKLTKFGPVCVDCWRKLPDDDKEGVQTFEIRTFDFFVPPVIIGVRLYLGNILKCTYYFTDDIYRKTVTIKYENEDIGICLYRIEPIKKGEA